MNVIRSLLGVLILGISTTLCMGGGGWPQKKNALYLKLGYWQVVYTKNYNQFGNQFTDRARGIYNLHVYAEYGVTDRLTTILYLPYYTKVSLAELYDANTNTVLAEGDAVSSVGDAELSIKYGIVKNDYWSVSPSIVVGVPFGIINGGRDGSLWTGDGELNTMLRVDVGGSMKIKNRYPYLNGYLGYNNRTNNFSNEIRYGLELGSEFGRLLFIGRADVVKSLKNKELSITQQSSNWQQINSEYLNISVEIGVKITDKIGISGNLTKAFIGKNIFANPSWSIGFFGKF